MKVAERFLRTPASWARIESDIVGGIIIEGRGERYDASVRAQLAGVRKNLSATFMGGGNDE